MRWHELYGFKLAISKASGNGIGMHNIEYEDKFISCMLFDGKDTV